MVNRLARSTSPYLQQHAGNPVDWWEWGDDAFAEARRRDVPLLLSVGYAACHWCHVTYAWGPLSAKILKGQVRGGASQPNPTGWCRNLPACPGLRLSVWAVCLGCLGTCWWRLAPL